MRSLRFLGCLLVASALAFPAAAEAQESWFGGLFGGGFAPARPAPPAHDGGGFSSEPLQLDVRPRRSPRRQVNSQRLRSVRVARPARVDAIAAHTEAYARLNPAINPRWHLEDPTLRHGDIVVLDRGVMVFVGQKASSHGASEFKRPAAVTDISNAERDSMEKLTVVSAD
jgi:hypothetical protein